MESFSSGGNPPLQEDTMSNAPGAMGRRQFLKSLGGGAGVAAIAAAPIASGPAAAAEGEDEKRKARYRATEHVKTFYQVNSYPKK
jgi:hypothetical protein